jgi:hypothetical protein
VVWVVVGVVLVLVSVVFGMWCFGGNPLPRAIVCLFEWRIVWMIVGGCAVVRWAPASVGLVARVWERGRERLTVCFSATFRRCSKYAFIVVRCE